MIFVGYIFVMSSFLFFYVMRVMHFSSQFPVHELKQNVFLVTILQAMTYLKSACCESNASVSK